MELLGNQKLALAALDGSDGTCTVSNLFTSLAYPSKPVTASQAAAWTKSE